MAAAYSTLLDPKAKQGQCLAFTIDFSTTGLTHESRRH